MKFKFPNYLTIGRIIIVPVFVFAFYLPGFYGDVIPFALFVIASFVIRNHRCPLLTNFAWTDTEFAGFRLF